MQGWLRVHVPQVARPVRWGRRSQGGILRDHVNRDFLLLLESPGNEKGLTYLIITHTHTLSPLSSSHTPPSCSAMVSLPSLLSRLVCRLFVSLSPIFSLSLPSRDCRIGCSSVSALDNLDPVLVWKGCVWREGGGSDSDGRLRSSSTLSPLTRGDRPAQLFMCPQSLGLRHTL